MVQPVSLIQREIGLKSPFSDMVCNRIFSPRAMRDNKLCKTRGDQANIRDDTDDFF